VAQHLDHPAHHDHEHDRGHDLAQRRSRMGSPATGPAVVLRWAGGRPVVGLSGEVDVAVAAQLRSVGALLAQHGQRADVDAAGVTFLDAAGLSALLELAGRGGSLLVLRPSPAVLRLLDLLERSGLGPAVLRAGPREEALVLRDAPRATTAPVVPAARRRPPAAR
jgi:anti-anti-sigma factor